NVDTFSDRALAETRRLMGFGHRVYKAGDPRASILRGMAEEACRQSGQFKWYEMAVKLHARINAAKGLIPNVDFYSAPLFYSLGIPVDLFTPVIAAGRIAGWTANILEQHDDNRLIRPRGEYVGPKRRASVSVEQRALSRPHPRIYSGSPPASHALRPPTTPPGSPTPPPPVKASPGSPTQRT